MSIYGPENVLYLDLSYDVADDLSKSDLEIVEKCYYYQRWEICPWIFEINKFLKKTRPEFYKYLNKDTTKNEQCYRMERIAAYMLHNHAESANWAIGIQPELANSDIEKWWMWFNYKYWNCFASQQFLFKRLNVNLEKKSRSFFGYRSAP